MPNLDKMIITTTTMPYMVWACSRISKTMVGNRTNIIHITSHTKAQVNNMVTKPTAWIYRLEINSQTYSSCCMGQGFEEPCGQPIRNHILSRLIGTMIFPMNIKICDFATFSGKNSKTAMELIGRFTTQWGELSNHGFYNHWIFPNSPIGQALTW